MRKFCRVCDSKFWFFQSYGIPKKSGRCPVCGAKSRTRAVAWYLESEVAPRMNPSNRILEIGANNVSISYLSHARFIGRARHTTLDLTRMPVHDKIKPPHDFVQMDATKMDFADASFDFVLCNHVLAFIPAYKQVLLEIRRVLKPGGEAMLNAALSPGHTRSANEVRTGNPSLGQDFFIENGTAWYFGQDDYLTDLVGAGFLLRELAPFAQLSASDLKTQGLKRDELLILARPTV